MQVRRAMLAQRASMSDVGAVNLIGAGVAHLLPRTQPLPRHETFTVVAQVDAAGDTEGAQYKMHVRLLGPSGSGIASQEAQITVPAPPTKSVPNRFLVFFAFAGLYVVDAGLYNVTVSAGAEDSTQRGNAVQFGFYIG